MHFIKNGSFSRKKDSDSDSDSCELVSKWPKIRILTSLGFKRFVPALFAGLLGPQLSVRPILV